MCDPITGAAIAMQVGGAAENMFAGQRSRKAVKRAIYDEQEKRHAITDASNRQFQITTDKVNPAEILAAVRARSGGYAAAQPAVTGRSFSPVAGPGVPAIAQRGVAARVGAVGREGARVAEGRGNLEGMGDFLLNHGVEHGRAMEDIATGNDFIRANLALLQAKIAEAEAKKKSPIGDALMMGGQLLGSVGPGMLGGAPTNIVPKAMGPGMKIPVGQSFVPMSYGSMSDVFRGIY